MSREGGVSMRTRAEQIAGIKTGQQFWRDLAAEVRLEEHVPALHAWLDPSRGEVEARS
jgi:hypothetical protein